MRPREKTEQMPEFLLDAITAGRPTVGVVSITLHHTTKQKIRLDQLEKVAPKLAAGPIYGLSSVFTEGASYLMVSLLDDGQEDLWIVQWARMPNTEAPAHVKENTFGSIAALERLMADLWHAHGDMSKNILQVTYTLTGYTTPLLRSAGKRFGSVMANPVGSFWQIHGGGMLDVVSPVKLPQKDALGLVAVANLEDGGWPDITGAEQRLWREILPLLKRGKKPSKRRKRVGK